MNASVHVSAITLGLIKVEKHGRSPVVPCYLQGLRSKNNPHDAKYGKWLNFLTLIVDFLRL